MISAIEAHPTRDGDRNGVEEVEACFAKEDLRTLFASLEGTGRREVDVVASGSLTSGRPFIAPFLVEVDGGHSRLTAWSELSADGSPTLGVESASGTPVRASVFDLRGRLVRRVEIPGAAGVRRFSLEAAASLLVGYGGREELDRDGAAQLLVGGAVDDGHAAAADDGVDAVMRDERAYRQLCGKRRRTRTVADGGGLLMFRKQ